MVVFWVVPLCMSIILFRRYGEHAAFIFKVSGCVWDGC